MTQAPQLANVPWRVGGSFPVLLGSAAASSSPLPLSLPGPEIITIGLLKDLNYLVLLVVAHSCS